MPTNGVMALASIAMIGSAAAAAAAAAAAPLSAGVERSGSQLTLTFRNGSQRRYRTNDRPDRGSPVYYAYKGFLPGLDAYAIEVRRIGRQVVLLPARTGAEVELGAQYKASPAKTHIFSSDCAETNCYLQVNAWPSGRLSFKLDHNGIAQQSDGTLLQSSVPVTRVHWLSERKVAFDMPCQSPGQPMTYRASALQQTGASWKLVPAAPCDAADSAVRE